MATLDPLISPFVPYTGIGDSTLVNALLAPNSGITITSVLLHSSGQNAVNYYDGSLSALGIGVGLLLTSGTTPGTTNTVDGFGTDNSTTVFNNGDANIDTVVNTVFQTQSYDATTLEFTFTANPVATSVSFDLVFGSDEYPEWVDLFVDCAIVMVNGVNYAYFNHDPLAPLSVVSSNLAAGYFQDNAGNVLPIEYDGVSHVLKIVAPINAGQENTINIGIADTGDHILDSGIFISNLAVGNIPGSGVVNPTTVCDDSNNSVTGSNQAEYFDLKGGDDIAYAGAGDDIVVAGAGNDVVYGGSGADEIEGDVGDDYLDGGADDDTAVFSGSSGSYTIMASAGGFTISGEGTDSLTNVEFVKFSDGLFLLNADGSLTPITPVTPPSNTPGLVAITGIGSVGNVLTAVVSDPDGISTGITYQWQSNGQDIQGQTSEAYTLTSTDAGATINVVVSYTDSKGASENLTSAAKSVASPNDGDFAIELLILEAPGGATVKNPLTTLLYDVIQLGVTPNQADDMVKAALGIDPIVDLRTYDAWAVLNNNSSTANELDAALAVEKVAVQVAVLTSAGGDQTGIALAQLIIEAANTGQIIDLSNTDFVSIFVGANSSNAFLEITDRNANIAEANNVDDIEMQWADFQSGLSVELSATIGDLSVHINQAPIGFATAELPLGVQDVGYDINAATLLAGFSDPEGDTLSVSGLTADNGSVIDNQDGTFTIIPPANFSGPVELTYEVIDGNGGSALASQLFVIAPNAPINHTPTGSATAVLAAGTEDNAYLVNAIDLLAGFSDADGDTLSVAWLSASNGSVTDNGTGIFTITPTVNFNGAVTLSYNVTDGNGSSVAATQSYTLQAANDAILGAASALLPHGTEDTPYTVIGATLLQGFSDVDIVTNGQKLSISGAVTANHGTVSYDSTTDTYTITPDANYNGLVSLSYNVTDSNGSTVAATLQFTLEAVNDAPTGSVTITGTATQAQTLTAANTLADLDGIPTSGANAVNYQWQVSTTANGSSGWTDIAGATNSTFTLTQDLVGKYVHVKASYIDLGGTSESLTSSATSTVTALSVMLTGSAAADTFNGDSGNDTLYGMGGNDTLNGFAGNDILDGGSGKDKMTGGSGDDTYIVDSTGDVVIENANEGADTIQTSISYVLGGNVDNLMLTGTTSISGAGNELANTLTGNSGNNTLKGMAGNDILIGGGGRDILIGGSGADQLTGGAGADYFKFESTKDSGIGSGSRDLIIDFITQSDKIDLSLIDAKSGTTKTNDAFIWKGMAAFTNVAGELHYAISGSNVVIEGDVNGDGSADLQIEVVGITSLQSADFAL